MVGQKQDSKISEQKLACRCTFPNYGFCRLVTLLKCVKPVDHLEHTFYTIMVYGWCSALGLKCKSRWTKFKSHHEDMSLPVYRYFWSLNSNLRLVLHFPQVRFLQKLTHISLQFFLKNLQKFFPFFKMFSNFFLHLHFFKNVLGLLKIFPFFEIFLKFWPNLKIIHRWCSCTDI